MDLRKLPTDLPVPVDDGGADHLLGMPLPNVPLACTGDGWFRPGSCRGVIVLFVYPMIGHPDKKLPEGWSEIPGARGCTVQALAYSDGYEELVRSGAQVFGVSRQSNDAQEEAVRGLALKEPLLSDADGSFAAGLRLPEFTVGRAKFLKRLTMGVVAGMIERVWYPVFPPGAEISAVISWLGHLAPREDGGKGSNHV